MRYNLDTNKVDYGMRSYLLCFKKSNVQRSKPSESTNILIATGSTARNEKRTIADYTIPSFLVINSILPLRKGTFVQEKLYKFARNVCRYSTRFVVCYLLSAICESLNSIEEDVEVQLWQNSSVHMIEFQSIVLQYLPAVKKH